MSAASIKRFRAVRVERGLAPLEAGEPLERFDAGELLRIARERLAQFSHTPDSTLRYAGALSTPDLIYHLAKHIEEATL
jgi:hypothetical protein